MLRVGAYCRVSTDDRDQANSFASQQRFFRAYIRDHPDWELVDIFADQGLSGTSTQKRREFNRMIDLALSGGIDLILTKEVSRFARNTVDTLQYTRRLKRAGVAVLFLSDGISTEDPDAELRLTIMASIAQEESRRTSQRVKWGQRRSMEQGVVFGRDMLGYDLRGGQLYLNEAGAETVRLIFHKFLEEGKGAQTIARELREAGIETARHMKEWSGTVILRVLRNEKYCGDLVQRKTFTPDYLTHQKKYNRGQEELVILRDHHPAIIPREIFERAQRELERRAPRQPSRHSSRHCLSGRIICGRCGSPFVPKSRRRKDGSSSLAWRCGRAARQGKPRTDASGETTGCPAGCLIRDQDLIELVQAVVRRLRLDRRPLFPRLLEVLRRVPGTADGEPSRRAAALEAKRERLIDLYAGGEITREEYRRLSRRYEEEAARLRAEEAAERQEDRGQSFGALSEVLRALAAGEVRDDTLYRSLVERIVVYSRERIEVYLHPLPEGWVFSLAKPPAPGQLPPPEPPEEGVILPPT